MLAAMATARNGNAVPFGRNAVGFCGAEVDNFMFYPEVNQLDVTQSKQRSRLAQRCNAVAQSTALIENRTVILMAAIDPEALAWRPLLQGMGLTVYNGFHQERIGDHPVVLISEALWRQSDWSDNATLIRRQFPGGILCVLSASVHRGIDGHLQLAKDWDDARTMLFLAGIDFFILEGLGDVTHI